MFRSYTNRVMVIAALALLAASLFLAACADDAVVLPTLAPTAVPVELVEPTEPAATPAPEGDLVWERVQAEGKIVVGTSADYPPFEYYTEAFELDGFDIALINELGRRLGLQVEIKDMAFDGLGDALLLGQIDAAISAISVTPEREATIAFSNIYFASSDAVMAASGSGITSVPDETTLAKLRVGAQLGTVYASWLATNLVDTGRMPAGNLFLFRDIDQALRDLNNGLIDLVMLDLEPAELAVNQGEFAIVGRGLFSQRYAIALTQEATTLLAELNRALFAMQGDGSLTRLVVEYFDRSSGEITPLPTPQPPTANATPRPSPTPFAGCIDGMEYVADLSYDDEGMTNPPQLQPGASFRKGWRVRNTGNCAWNNNYALAPVGGNNPEAVMSGQPIAPVRLVQPGQEYDFWADLVAPQAAGIYQEFWTMRNNSSGALFGYRMWVGIEVVALPTATPPPTQTPSANIGFSASPTTILQGQCTTLAWSTQNVQAVYLYKQGDPWQNYGVPSTGSKTVCPAVTTVYELRVVKGDNSVEIRQVTVYVTPVVGGPTITSFVLEPTGPIAAGQCVIISWSVAGTVNKVVISRNDVFIWDDAPVSGSMQDCPPGTGEQIYSLEATGPGGTSRVQRSLSVVDQLPTATPTIPPLPTSSTG